MINQKPFSQSIQSLIAKFIEQSDCLNESIAVKIEYSESLIFIYFLTEEQAIRISINTKTHVPFTLQIFRNHLIGVISTLDFYIWNKEN